MINTATRPARYTTAEALQSILNDDSESDGDFDIDDTDEEFVPTRDETSEAEDHQSGTDSDPMSKRPAVTIVMRVMDKQRKMVHLQMKQ
ncbi:UNVERIFIED_CONTAM: hypothetical protein FKN15_057950 [Acipenser sinensis]